MEICVIHQHLAYYCLSAALLLLEGGYCSRMFPLITMAHLGWCSSVFRYETISLRQAPAASQELELQTWQSLTNSVFKFYTCVIHLKCGHRLEWVACLLLLQMVCCRTTVWDGLQCLGSGRGSRQRSLLAQSGQLQQNDWCFMSWCFMSCVLAIKVSSNRKKLNLLLVAFFKIIF